MSGLVLFVLVAVQVVVFIAVIVFFIASTIVSGDSGGKKGFSQFICGFLSFFFIVFWSSFGWYDQGSISRASNSGSNALQEGVLFTKVYSKEILDVTNEDQHNGKIKQNFDVWLEWNNGDRACLYRLKKNPPDKFTVDGDGNFVEVK